MIILAFDGLEYGLVHEYGCPNLVQDSYGTTDISDFEEPRSVVLWSSFIAGENLEDVITMLDDDQMWKYTVKPENTFFSGMGHKITDLPGYNYSYRDHKTERDCMDEFFDAPTELGRRQVRHKYISHILANQRTKRQHLQSIIEERTHEIVLTYFSFTDTIPHLNMGSEGLMEYIYMEADDIVRWTREHTEEPVLVLSDHGMKQVGDFGDHSDHGFWSINRDVDWDEPKLHRLGEKFIKID